MRGAALDTPFFIALSEPTYEANKRGPEVCILSNVSYRSVRGAGVRGSGDTGIQGVCMILCPREPHYITDIYAVLRNVCHWKNSYP